MGCTASVVVSEQTGTRSKSRNISNTVNINIQTTTLTHEDKVKIKDSWQILSNDMLGNGGKILLRLFEINGEIKEILGLAGLDGKSLNNNPAFKHQSSRLMQTIGTSVDSIDDLDNTIVPVLHQLGRQHFTYTRFVQKLWNPFPEAVLYVWKEELHGKFTPDVPVAWSALLLLIICKMKDGYQQACSEDTLKKLNNVAGE